MSFSVLPASASPATTRSRWEAVEDPHPPSHRELLDGPFWRASLPAWADVSHSEFGDHRWQLRNSVKIELRGTMRRSCRIGDGIEDINVWSRRLEPLAS